MTTRKPLIDLIDDPKTLENQLFQDALIALEAIASEIREKGFVNTQKNQAFVSLTKLVRSHLEAKKAAREDSAELMNKLVVNLPFHEEGIDPIQR